MHPLLLSAALLFTAAVVVLGLAVTSLFARRALVQRIGAITSDGGRKALPGQAMVRWQWGLDPEVPVFLERLGWRSPKRRVLFLGVQMTMPLLCLALLVIQWLVGAADIGQMVLLLFGAGLGYLLPKRWLSAAVKQRQERLAREVATLIPLLRMLFEVGMTVEQALRVLVKEGGEILPELTSELRLVLARVDAGLELGPELRAMAALLDVDELTDCTAILEQLIRQGGGALASLLALKKLLDDRRATTLQERVSKLSAKMSAVMVGCLFPALLIILAGPGFIAVFRALGEMSG